MSVAYIPFCVDGRVPPARSNSYFGLGLPSAQCRSRQRCCFTTRQLVGKPGWRGCSKGKIALHSATWNVEPVCSDTESFTFGDWRIRKIRQDEIRDVANIQAEAFVEPLPIPGVSGLQRKAFTAEVLDILQRKLRNSPPDRFCCLVGERIRGGEPGVHGVVELSLEEDRAVMRSVECVEGYYAYVSCMAVSPDSRRQGLASIMLKSAERLARERWGRDKVCLHVYQDNAPAVQLYQSSGYVAASTDPAWKAMIGGRRRMLLVKKV